MIGPHLTCTGTAWFMVRGMRDGVVLDTSPRGNIIGRDEGQDQMMMMILMTRISECEETGDS